MNGWKPDVVCYHHPCPFVGYFVVGTNKQTGKLTKFWGLRSEHHRENVSEIAVSLGGGGHRNASGFRQIIGE